MPDLPEPPRPASSAELFLAFTRLSLQGFGGVLPVAQRVLCEERRWVTRAEFLDLLAVGQALPGPNVCNVAVMIGYRFRGLRGALAALAGMMAVPALLVLSLAALQDRLQSHQVVAGAVRGMAAVSAGLVGGTVLRLAGALRGSPLGAAACLALGAAAFVLVALLGVPLPWALLATGLPAVALAWRRAGPGAAGGAPP